MAKLTRMGFFDGDATDHREGDDSGFGASGDVPPAGAERLAALGSHGMFSSTLSATEFALLSELGPRPLAQVMGTSVYQVGWQYLRPDAQWGGSDFHCRLDVVSQAWDDARRLAFGRLLAEGRSVGADAVVGVKLRRGEHDWARRSVDFIVNGTAIRLPDNARDGGDSPVLSDLSVQDYWKLVSGGWAPCGLLAATAVFFVSQGFWTRLARRSSFFRNQELIEFSDGFVDARRAVVEDLHQQARTAGAHGVVGVTLDYRLDRRKIRVMRMRQQPSGYGVGTIALGGGDAPMQRGGSDSRDGIVFTVNAVGTGVRQVGEATPSLTPTIIGLGARP
ncbi:MAG: heavy metal-binding domain-containing protein [Conexibacteraceae bacterium]|nr:heavy metal-binding domain-containing protein [Conexibacteraceae bacterium]